MCADMWDLTYKTKDEYLDALRKAAGEQGVKDASRMVSDFRKYFNRRRKEYEGDMEVISRLPLPETLAAQYAGCTWGKRRAVRKEGRAGAGKRFGIFLMNIFVYVVYAVLYLVLALGVLAGLLTVIAVAAWQMNWMNGMPDAVNDLYLLLPNSVLQWINGLSVGDWMSSPSGSIFLISVSVFVFFLFGTLLKGMRRLMKRYRNWTLTVISGRFRLPVSMEYVYSTPWRVLTYVLLPLSIVGAVASGFLLWIGM